MLDKAKVAFDEVHYKSGKSSQFFDEILGKIDMIQQPNLTNVSKNQIRNLARFYENTTQIWNLSSLVSEYDMSLSDGKSTRSFTNIDDGKSEDIKRNTIMYVYNQGPIVLPFDENTIDSQHTQSGRQIICEGENIVIENDE
jgi:hypothetical protein